MCVLWVYPKRDTISIHWGLGKNRVLETKLRYPVQFTKKKRAFYIHLFMTHLVPAIYLT